MEPWIPFLLALMGAPALTFFGEFVSRTAQAKRIKALAEAAITLGRPVATDAVAELIAAEADPSKPKRSKFWRLSIAIVLTWATILLILLIDYTTFLSYRENIDITIMFRDNRMVLMVLLLFTIVLSAIWYNWTQFRKNFSKLLNSRKR